MSILAYVKKLAPPGNLPEAYIDWKGPASYTVVTAGTPATGGDQMPAQVFGVNQLVNVDASGGSATGNFQVIPIPATPTLWILQWRALRTATIGGQAQTAGLEAVAGTNLSAEKVRIQVVGLSG